MIKNTAGQKIGAQLVSATDGSAFTGAVTVEITIDAGTQATGTVGSGACTHEGNGYHTYAPSQAETNGSLLAFTFHGTGAVPVTVQVFTVGFDPTLANVPSNVTQISGDGQSATDLKDFADAGYDPATNKVEGVKLVDTLTTYTGNTPQTGDSFARLGAPAGASVSADIAAIEGQTDDIGAILADTNELQTDWANGGRLDNILDARASQTSVDDLPTNAELATALAAADDAVLAAIAALNNLSQANIRTAVGLASANLDTQLAAKALETSLQSLITTVGVAGAGLTAIELTSAERNAISDALINRNIDGGSSAGRTIKQCLATLRNKVAIAAGVMTVYEQDGTTPMFEANVATTAGDPISSISPTT